MPLDIVNYSPRVQIFCPVGGVEEAQGP